MFTVKMDATCYNVQKVFVHKTLECTTEGPFNTGLDIQTDTDRKTDQRNM